MGSITEKQKEFIVPNWSYPRPGVAQTPQGMELEGDWYDIRVMDDQSVSVFRINDNKTMIGIRRTLGVLKTKGRKLWNSWFHRRS